MLNIPKSAKNIINVCGPDDKEFFDKMRRKTRNHVYCCLVQFFEHFQFLLIKNKCLFISLQINQFQSI